jgi:formiminotetrahydrofolate cyclodeaminase
MLKSNEENRMTRYFCEDFVFKLASNTPVPGGGGASALVGAIGMALGDMVGSLTLGKKKYADVKEDIERLKIQAGEIERELLHLIERDAEVFEPLSRAYGLPKETEEEQAHKAQVMEAALKEACSVPLSIMERCCEAILLIEEFAQKGTAIAISDAGCGAACCRAALTSASMNVFINTKAMTDRAYAEEINRKASAMLEEYIPMSDAITTSVLARFR